MFTACSHKERLRQSFLGRCILRFFEAEGWREVHNYTATHSAVTYFQNMYVLCARESFKAEHTRACSNLRSSIRGLYLMYLAVNCYRRILRERDRISI